MADRIGDFEFLSLQGSPSTLTEEIGVMVRPGADGYSLWKKGIRGRPFRLRSAVDADSVEDARALFVQYSALIASGLVELVCYNVTMGTTENYTVAVLAVHQVSITPLIGAVGGLSSTPAAVLECDWDLLPVENEA